MPARVYLTRRHVRAEQVSLRQRDPVALDQPDPLEPVHLAAGYATALSLVVQDIVHDHFGVRQGGDREGDGQAGFVQVVQGRVSDIDRARERMHALQDALKVHLPALLGTVTVELGAGRFTRVLYFSTEDEARAGEREMPPEIRARDEEARQLVVGPVEFLDLREPWLYTAR